MTRRELPDRIVVDPRVLVGKPIVRGTRISVEFVVNLLALGWTPERILQEYRHLERADIDSCRAYAGTVLRREKLLREIENFATRKGIRKADVIRAIRKRRKRG